MTGAATLRRACPSGDSEESSLRAVATEGRADCERLRSFAAQWTPLADRHGRFPALGGGTGGGAGTGAAAVLTLTPAVKIFLYAEATDMRRSFDKLAEMARSQLAQDP